MALEIRQNLKLSHQLVMTPQLQQSIKLLQLSRLELLEVVRDELLENPTLEEEAETGTGETAPLEGQEKESPTDELSEKNSDPSHQEVMENREGEIKEPQDFDWENYLNTYNAPEHISGGLDELPSYENTLSQRPGLYDHLTWQLHLSNLTPEEEVLGVQILQGINEDGYLQDKIEEIAEKADVPIEKVEFLLGKIQKFDPPGVGARDLKECLLLQIRFFGHEREALECLVQNHLQDLEKKDYRRIARDMKLPLDQILHLAKLIREFDPKPGRPFLESSAEYITPDAYLYKVGLEWVVVLNEDGLPKLHISSFYRKMALNYQAQANTKEYVQTKLRSALWLIRSIQQRQRTLYKVIRAIVKFQKDFFEKGIEFLRPMILRDVAEEIEMHESTVSRVTTHKYVHTPRGLFELKYFFNNGLPSGEGNSMASETIKNKIRQIISQEDPKSPHSDQFIAEVLQAGKIDIARRTVAKYREMLGILPSSKRKQLF